VLTHRSKIRGCSQRYCCLPRSTVPGMLGCPPPPCRQGGMASSKNALFTLRSCMHACLHSSRAASPSSMCHVETGPPPCSRSKQASKEETEPSATPATLLTWNIRPAPLCPRGISIACAIVVALPHSVQAASPPFPCAGASTPDSHIRSPGLHRQLQRYGAAQERSCTSRPLRCRPHRQPNQRA